MCEKTESYFFPGESVMKLNNSYRIEYFWFVITNILSFCSNHKVLKPRSSLGSCTELDSQSPTKILVRFLVL